MNWTTLKLVALVVGTSVLASLCASYLMAPSPGFEDRSTARRKLNETMRQVIAERQALVGDAALKPGDEAPDFTCDTVDDQPLNLADFKGKYVLLDFWATWCGPCVAETPHLKSTFDAFGKDDRFAMISLSMDYTAEAPKKFARDRGLSWTQGFLPAATRRTSDSIAEKYGVFGIPSIFLIGPDGKVLANNLRGEGIKAAVAAALQKSAKTTETQRL